MDSKKWELVQAIFDAAAELNPDQREQFLKQQCGNDSELEAEVKSLLAADEKQHSMLDGLAVDYVSPVESVEYEGRQIGPYTLERLIGSGGMGLVFLASRADGQFKRSVALKLIRDGSLTQEIRLRFDAERQILARLDHPNIARLFDGGFSDTGYPYFTMEYVDGKPIDQYCREHNLPIEDRLSLFLQVCAAVEYAQNKAVIHRDLKPTNILVTANLEVKLLDFGIAKLIAEDATHAMTELTRTGMRVMTPAYAAPEQIRGEAISAATDVYSLGVILYELLTDQRPFPTGNRSQQELEQAICSTDPIKPSVAVVTDTQNVLAGERPTFSHEHDDTLNTPMLHRRSRKLRGDLDNICLMALRKEPERRYQNATELIADIQRHRDGLPVKARASTFGYRAQKFLRRNKLAVATGAAAVLVLAFIIGFYTIKLTGERDLAQQESLKATAVSNFLTRLFQVADPGQTRGESVTARELLDQGVERIDSDLKDQPEIRAQLLNVIGGVYYNLGMYDESAHLLNRSADLYDSLGGKTLAEVSALHSMANAVDAAGNSDSALVLFRVALSKFAALPEDAATLLEQAGTKTDMAVIYRHQGEYAAAESLYLQGLEVRRKQLGEMNEDVAHSLNHVGRLYYNQGEYDRARPYLREALSIREKLLGPLNPATLASFGAVAGLFSKQGEDDSARVYYGKALAGFLKVMGPEHPYSAACMSSYGRALFDVGEIDSAEYWLNRGLEESHKLYPPEHISLSYPLLGLGEVSIARKKYIEAEDYLKRALEIRKASLPADHVDVAAVQLDLGIALIGQTRFADARDILETCLNTFMTRRGPDDQNTQKTLHQLAIVYYQLGESGELARVSDLIKE